MAAAAVAAMEAATATAAAAQESQGVAAVSLHDKSRVVQAVFSIITPRTRTRIHTHTHIRTDTHTHTMCTITTPTWPTMTTAITASATILHPAQHKTIQGIISAHSTSHPSSSVSTRISRTQAGANL